MAEGNKDITEPMEKDFQNKISTIIFSLMQKFKRTN